MEFLYLQALLDLGLRYWSSITKTTNQNYELNGRGKSQSSVNIFFSKIKRNDFLFYIRYQKIF